MIFAMGLSGCAGTWTSGRPIYPSSWPALETGHGCPDLSGTYRAVSDEAAPLVYPPGQAPREMFFFVTYGKPLPPPPLGRRTLTWHFAGSFSSRDQALWNALTRYANALNAEAAKSGPKGEAGWVEVRGPENGTVEVHAGIQHRTFLEFSIRKEAQSLWTYKMHIYQCENGGLVVIGSFPSPPEESPTGQSAVIGAKFTFFRAADKSLIALEEAYTGVLEGNMEFNKWWRWRPVDRSGQQKANEK